jgi:hypothetical protein
MLSYQLEPMGTGLGTAQRQMLVTLARREVWVAEIATQMQRHYRPPDRWSLRGLTWATYRAEITGMQYDRHQIALAAGGNRVIQAIAQSLVRRRPDPVVPDDFAAHRPAESDIQMFNPSRAVIGLERRGFVLRDRSRRRANLALTVEGFAEARRLGGVADSEVVDLDQLAANWRETWDFALGEEFVLYRDDDARQIVRHWDRWDRG